MSAPAQREEPGVKLREANVAKPHGLEALAGEKRAGSMMLAKEIVLVAMGALRANKMRSFLTMLGIVIGVAAVIAMVAIGKGAQKSISDRIAGLGTTLLTVRPRDAARLPARRDHRLEPIGAGARDDEVARGRRRCRPKSLRRVHEGDGRALRREGDDHAPVGKGFVHHAELEHLALRGVGEQCQQRKQHIANDKKCFGFGRHSPSPPPGATR